MQLQSQYGFTNFKTLRLFRTLAKNITLWSFQHQI